MNSTWQIALLLLGAYLVGSIPMAFLVARAFGGVDIRKVGTHNVGASNVMRTTSKWLAVPVILFDIAKGAFVVWAARHLGFSITVQVAAGLAAIVGHNWPVWLGFSGGRGIATSLGVILMLSIPIGLIVLVGAYLFAPFKQMAVGVFVVLFALPFMSWFFASTFGVEEKGTVTVGYIIITVIAYLRRLIHRRSELSQKTPLPELVFNRLFFDRDIRDRKLWLHREQAGA